MDEMLRDRRLRRVFLVVYWEVFDKAEALGVELECIAANPWLF